MVIRFRCLGECAFDVGDERLGPEAELAFALLLVLVMSGGRRLSRRQVVDLLWPATSEERARHNLRQTLYKLRQLGVPVESEAGHLRLDPADVDAAPALGARPDDAPPEVLLRPDVPFGEFLAGYVPRFAAPFAAWVEEQRGLVHARLRRHLLLLLADERRRGNWGLVETLARKCLLVDPLNEEATMALAEATALSGSKRAALQLLDGYLRELGPDAGDMRLPAAVLRRRIAERIPASQSSFGAVPDCFVGRERSVALLRERLQASSAGRGRALLVHAEAGMGKSRLVTEFARMAELEGARVARVASQARDVDRPLSAFVDVVPLLQALPGALGCTPESIAYLRRLVEHDPEVLEPSEATREAELLFASVRRSIFDLMDAVADESPLVLCFEDVHWLDERSWRVVRELAAWLDARPVLLLMTSRLPHATPREPAQPTPWLERHLLPPLDRASAMALFATVTASSGAPPAYRDWSVHVSAGNPFFVRALAVHWLETGEVRAPASLEQLVAERVSRLTGRPLRTLQACAVLGKEATLARVESMLEYPHHELIEATSSLEEQGFLLAEGAAIPCRHELIARAALARLHDGVRRLLHRRAGEVLERDVRDARSAALLWDCAQQWQAAGERLRAVALVRSSAAHMLEVGLPAEAAEAYERALELCETDAERLEMLEGLARANQYAGRWPKVIATLSQMRESYHARGFDQLAAEDELLSLEARWRTGEDITGLLEEAIILAEDASGLASERLRAGWLALIFADTLCDVSKAEYVFKTLNDASFGIHDDSAARHDMQFRMIYHASYGDLQTAVALAQQLIGDTSLADTDPEWIRIVSRATIPLRRAGRYSEASAQMRRALNAAESLNLASAAASAADILAMTLLEQDQVSAATRWLKHAEHWSAVQEGGVSNESVQLLAARIALYTGDTHRASELLQRHAAGAGNHPNLRHRNEILALTLDLELQAGETPSAAAIAQLHEGFEAAKRHGGQDYPCSILVRSLRSTDNEHRAGCVLDGYIASDRRETSQLPRCLRLLLPD